MPLDAAATGPPSTASPPAGGGEPLVPGWLERLAAIGWRVLVTVALVVLAGFAAIQLSIVTGAILVALIVAAVVYPLVQQLRDRGWPRARAAGAVSVLALLVVVVTLLLIAVAFIPYVAEIARLVIEGIDTVDDELAAAGLPESLQAVVTRAMRDAHDAIVAGVSSLVAPIANFVTILILGGFLTFYLLEDGDRAWVGATSNLADWRAAQLTGRGIVALERVGGYLRGTAVLAATDALAAWLFLTLLGVPLAGPLTVLAFIAGFIPYLGGVVTVSALALVTLGTQGPMAAVILLALVGVTFVLQERFLAPRAFGPNARVPAAVALIALLAGGALFGAIGLFAAVPIVAAVVAFAPGIVHSLGGLDAGPSQDAMVPVWLDRLGQWSWRALVVLGLAWLLVQVAIAPFFSIPVVVAILVAPALAPVVAELRRRGLSRTMAVLTVIVATIAIITLVLYVTIASLAQSMDEIAATTATGADKLGLGTAPADLVATFTAGIGGTVASVVVGITSFVIVLAIGILLIFLLLRDGAAWWSLILTRVPLNRRDRIDEVGVQSVNIMRGTMTGTAIASLAGAVLQWATMFILGLPLAFPISVLMFFGGFIPYIGSLIVTALGFLVAVAVGDTTDIVLMGIFTIVFNLVQGNIVAPLVFGRTVSIHPAAVLLAAPAGAAIAGIMGMVLMTPILAIIKRTWRIILHLFDPEHQQPPVAAASLPPPSPSPVPVRGPDSPVPEGAEP